MQLFKVGIWLLPLARVNLHRPIVGVCKVCAMTTQQCVAKLCIQNYIKGPSVFFFYISQCDLKAMLVQKRLVQQCWRHNLQILVAEPRTFIYLKLKTRYL